MYYDAKMWQMCIVENMRVKFALFEHQISQSVQAMELKYMESMLVTYFMESLWNLHFWSLIAPDCINQYALYIIWLHNQNIMVKNSSSVAFTQNQKWWKPGILADFGARFLPQSSLCFSGSFPKSAGLRLYLFNQSFCENL